MLSRIHTSQRTGHSVLGSNSVGVMRLTSNISRVHFLLNLIRLEYDCMYTRTCTIHRLKMTRQLTIGTNTQLATFPTLISG